MAELSEQEINLKIKSAKEFIAKSREAFEAKEYQKAVDFFDKADGLIQDMARTPSCSDLLETLGKGTLRLDIYTELRKKKIMWMISLRMEKVMKSYSHLDHGEEVLSYFSDTNPIFRDYLKKHKDVLFFMYDMMEKPNWMCGMDWYSLKQITADMKEFKLMKTDLKEFTGKKTDIELDEKCKEEIKKYKRFIVMILFSKNDKHVTLDRGTMIAESNFSDEYGLLYQLFMDEPSATSKIAFLMMR